MKPGDIVKFSKPVNEAEKKARFVLLDDPAVIDRVDIELICDLPFRPVERVAVSEIELADGHQ